MRKEVESISTSSHPFITSKKLNYYLVGFLVSHVTFHLFVQPEIIGEQQLVIDTE